MSFPFTLFIQVLYSFMIEHALFPTLVCEFDYPRKDLFKRTFYDRIFDYMTDDGYSNEFTGHVNIHHEESFLPFFQFAIDCVKQYASRLHIDNERFDYNITKTWLNIKKENSTNLHHHRDAHISFTYYVNVPESFSRPIRFHNYEHRNEPYSGSILYNNTSNTWDEINAYSWQFNPKEGQMFVFPSSLPHDTIGQNDSSIDSGTTNEQELSQNRICLAGDIVMTYKENTRSPLGVQPISNWRTFE